VTDGHNTIIIACVTLNVRVFGLATGGSDRKTVYTGQQIEQSADVRRMTKVYNPEVRSRA